MPRKAAKLAQPATRAVPAPVTVTRREPTRGAAWARAREIALALAVGDRARLVDCDDGSVIVTNRPR